MTISDQEQFRLLVEKHKADDEQKTFFFKDKYYTLKRDEYNPLNWVLIPMTVEKYNSMITAIPLNITTLPPAPEISPSS